jgi:2,3-bisphosphoglycerate-dependent phosphoglycerate mutase
MSPCLYLVRHAQSANNALDEQLRIPDPPITPLGETQSERLAVALDKLELTQMWVSPFLRSVQTARSAAQRIGLRPRIRRDIFEQGGCYRGYARGDRHPMPGMGREELAQLCPDWAIDPDIGSAGWNPLDHYEELDEARARAVSVVQWIEGSSWAEQDRLALIIHADFKLRMLEALLDRDDLEAHLGEVVNTSITRVSRSASRWRLDFWNSHQHLESELVTS